MYHVYSSFTIRCDGNRQILFGITSGLSSQACGDAILDFWGFHPIYKSRCRFVFLVLLLLCILYMVQRNTRYMSIVILHFLY